MSDITRRFRSINDREAKIIWAICKQSPTGRWSGITQAMEEIRRVRGGKSITRQTVYDFLNVYPEPCASSDGIGKENALKRKSPEEIIKGASIQTDAEDLDGRIKQRASDLLYSILHRLWKGNTLLLDAGGMFYSKEKRADYWISWANPPLFHEEYGWGGPTVFPDSEHADERNIKVARILQERDRLLVYFKITWETT